MSATNTLQEIDVPAMQPLAASAEYDDYETEFKAAIMAVFESMVRENERRLNLYGMPHLGDSTLIEQVLKADGIAIVRRDATRTAFLLKAARARNPRRGMIFLRQYLQSVWPGAWSVEPLWHPVATSANYPADASPRTLVALDVDTVADYTADPTAELPVVYRTDWQGKMPMYAAARTNAFKNSASLTAGFWTQPVVGAWNVTTSTDIPAADGQAANVTKFVSVPGAKEKNFARQTGLTIPLGQRVTSLWIYVVSAQVGVLNWGFSVDYENVDNGVEFVSTVFGQWVRAASVTTLTAARTIEDLNMRVNGGSPSANFTFYAAFAQDEPGAVPTRFIATGATPAPYTDYTIDAATGIATFTDGLTDPAPLTYFRTGRIRVSLPVSVDNGLGLQEIAKAFRPTLAARLMLKLELVTVFEDIGQSGGLALANAAKAVMPIMAIGTLKIGN